MSSIVDTESSSDTDVRQIITIVMPVFNDWNSLQLLVVAINDCMAITHQAVRIVAVNDGSTLEHTFTAATFGTLPYIVNVHIVHLTRNFGHQRAIAIGLCYAADEFAQDYTLIMDSDGEDKPEDIRTLVEASIANAGKIIFAERAKRSESLSFRFFYALYKRVYRLLTGAPISFGNFSLIPPSLLRRVSSVSEVWLHVAAGIVKARLPYMAVPTVRGRRLAGESKMNFVALLLHGLSGIAVHSDIAAARLLVVSLAFIGFSVVGIGVVLGIRLFSGIVVLGWASSSIATLISIFIEALLMSVMLVFLVLNTRSQQPFVPRLHYKDYLAAVEKLYHNTLRW
jgi:polyisoprenyl-phosphate glycosyltransferase